MSSILQQTSDFLEKSLKLDKNNLVEMINELQKLRLELANEKSVRRAELFQLRSKYRHPKDKKYTDFDRQTLLNDMTSEEYAMLELLEDLSDLLKDRNKTLELLLTSATNQS